MYITNSVLEILYNELGNFFEHKGTLVSSFKYFIALDKFKKANSKLLEYNNPKEKKEFCDNVGELVLLGEPKETTLFTKDFGNNVVELKEDPDFHTNGNLLTQSSCRLANNSPNKKFPYPKTENHEKILLTAYNYTLDIDKNSYSNFYKSYLNNSVQNSVLLTMWLARFCWINNYDSYFEDVVKFIKNQYTNDFVSALQINEIAFKTNFEKKKLEILNAVGKNDFLSSEIGDLKIIPNSKSNNVKETLIVNDEQEEDYTLEQLKQLYSEMESKETSIDGNTTAIPVLFGIKYGKVIRKHNYPIKEITKWDVELRHGLKVYDNLVNNTFGIRFYDRNEKDFQKSQHILSSSPSSYTHPQQIIFYGVPGCGKSHKISEMLKDKNQFKIDSEEEQVARTVFHPDYTNSDFVGQILPSVDNGKIEYKFTPGPFTKILAKALKHSENQYVLIIEEINRGNAATIFGEIFQLLDRIKSGKTTAEKLRDGTLNTYGEGWSEYFFMNDEINHYILKECNGDESNKSVNISGICFSENTGIRLPPNLSILATMNTSDQNVFTLDNAFQRRWNMEYVPNKIDYDSASDEQKNQYDSEIGETGVKWGDFRNAVNDEISNSENSFSNAEDKQLGLFFVQAEGDISKNPGKILENDFANKVLKYLWNDVFKRSQENVFSDDIKTFGELLTKCKGQKALENCFKIKFEPKSDSDVQADSESSSE